jgi:prophage maintenance system killer protein
LSRHPAKCTSTVPAGAVQGGNIALKHMFANAIKRTALVCWQA